MTNKTALVVEDDTFICKYLQLMLEDKGFYVVPCHTIEQASSAIESIKFDLAVVDGLLPDGNGVSFADSLTCKVIICSGISDEFNRKAMWNAGTVFQKPVDASFNQCIDRLMR